MIIIFGTILLSQCLWAFFSAFWNEIFTFYKISTCGFREWLAVSGIALPAAHAYRDKHLCNGYANDLLWGSLVHRCPMTLSVCTRLYWYWKCVLYWNSLLVNCIQWNQISFSLCVIFNIHCQYMVSLSLSLSLHLATRQDAVMVWLCLCTAIHVRSVITKDYPTTLSN